MNVLTVLAMSVALAAGEPGPAEGGKSPVDGAAKAKSPAPAKKASTTGSLDDDLFGDLTGELFQGLDKPKLGSREGKEGKAAPAKSPPGKEPAKKSSEKPKAGEIAPADDFPPGEDLGQESNPLLDIGQRMRRAGSLISEGSTGNPTQRLQRDIVQDLDRLIEFKKKSCPICNNSSSSGNKNQSNMAKAGQPKNGKGSGDFTPNPRPKDSQEGDRKGKVKEAKTDAMIAAEKEVWGLLPERVQEAIRNAQSSKVISEYSSEVKDYFTRLAEMYQRGDKAEK